MHSGLDMRLLGVDYRRKRLDRELAEKLFLFLLEFRLTTIRDVERLRLDQSRLFHLSVFDSGSGLRIRLEFLCRAYTLLVFVWLLLASVVWVFPENFFLRNVQLLEQQTCRGFAHNIVFLP